jgi:hypothetical protein
MALIQAVEFFSLARERETIRRKRLAGEPPPWTEDSILRQWRFTNVHREHDKTTIWLREHVREKTSGLRLVEATLIFRWFNFIATGERLEDLLLDGWNSDEARRRLTGVGKIVTGAYMVRTPFGVTKLEALLALIDKALPMLPAMVERWGDSLEAAWRDLITISYMGIFTSGEVVIDLRYTPILSRATDINTWTIAGPGAAKGLGYVAHGNPAAYDYSSATHQLEMVDIMCELLELSRDPAYWPAEWDPWELHECEMWACEHAKYQSALEGGRLKRRYTPCA